MTHLITGLTPAVKKAVVPSVNLTVNGPYYPTADGENTPFNQYIGGVIISSSSDGGVIAPGFKIVKITINTGDLLNMVSNVCIASTDNTLLSVTGYPGLKPTKTPFKLIPGAYIYSAFPLGGPSKKIGKKTTITFTFKKAVPEPFPILVGPNLTLDKKTGFYWYGSDKTVLFGPQKKDLTKLTIPSTTKIIVKSAFKACTKLAGSLTIPDNVTYIGDRAFSGCTKLTGNLKIGKGVTSIGARAFEVCTKLTGNLKIGNGVKTIGIGAFDGCIFAGTLTLGSSLTSIPANLFNGKFSGSLTIPDSVTSIGDGAFENCGFTGNLRLSNKITSIGDRAFIQCNFTGPLTIPNSVTSIGEYAFYDCGFTGNITLGNKLKSIGAGAFYDCDFIGPLTIPIGVTSIGSQAFFSCDKLNGALTIANTNIKMTGSFIFAYCNGLTGSVSVYRANMTGDPFAALPGVTVTYLDESA